MRIKGVDAKAIRDSRKERTIYVSVKTEEGLFVSSSPSGKSKGKYEKPYYISNIEHDINMIKKSDFSKLKLEKFSDLKKIEKAFSGKLGSNSVISLELSMLKALASSERKHLWEIINPKAKNFPFPAGNCIGGGLHSRLLKEKKPDFQEFLIIPKTKNFFENVFLMKKAYDSLGKELEVRKAKGEMNDENAFSTSLSNEEVLEIMKKVKEELESQVGKEIDIGVDIASSTFYTGFVYNYKNKKNKLKTKEQVDYVLDLIDKYNLDYIEDPLEENDFSGFSELRHNAVIVRPTCTIVGDDLTASNLTRFKRALKEKSINAIILKPNQIGSLIEISEIVKLAKKFSIKTVMSHRSGETLDNSLADLSFGFQTDYIKTGIAGEEREVKLKRMIEISKSLGT